MLSPREGETAAEVEADGGCDEADDDWVKPTFSLKSLSKLTHFIVQILQKLSHSIILINIHQIQRFPFLPPKREKENTIQNQSIIKKSNKLQLSQLHKNAFRSKMVKMLTSNKIDLRDFEFSSSSPIIFF